jgi:hypothetical protein
MTVGKPILIKDKIINEEELLDDNKWWINYYNNQINNSIQ